MFIFLFTSKTAQSSTGFCYTLYLLIGRNKPFFIFNLPLNVASFYYCQQHLMQDNIHNMSRTQPIPVGNIPGGFPMRLPLHRRNMGFLNQMNSEFHLFFMILVLFGVI